jgi:hypothetical protein
MSCPKCQQHDVEPRAVGFTWWGGVLGSKLLHHVECPRCFTRYNGKTGQSNNTAITIYMIVVGVLALFVGYALTRGH